MKKMIRCFGLALICLVVTSPAFGQLDYGEDFTASDAVYQVVHVKVASNMVPYYLEGIKQTWAAANDLSIELGHLERYAVYSNVLTDNGDYNLTLVSEYKDLAQYDKGRTDFRTFEKEWEKRLPEEKQEAIVKTYPNMRTIVGEYLLRRIEFK